MAIVAVTTSYPGRSTDVRFTAATPAALAITLAIVARPACWWLGAMGPTVKLMVTKAFGSGKDKMEAG